ncbi:MULTISPECIES: LPS export ABC transporter permease LptF [unclassified Herbaspirillum]|uniref:LPS export ABC transporter permease LptF n=1 Tax=unclassified Herbaspirillum TaxID=2624150 RepID=UPI00114FA742|nr:MULTISPECIES: LPS export ABC transporter permease LptF [unclassified Herbaspirillum]TQK13548.1 lipopolysaccharide export system permease protein [Herbaspirillum sp. SJZ130]TQK15551.1 lipopolysaccharide export system permease protein [Herbaspirillum sp. SJZ106]TWC71451.1 lipopolysaccharide export system permease protein [Herbaspirillum sp. SJZ099]
MIFQRALRRELTSTAGAVFTTLFTITLTVMLIKILGQAAGGQVASQDVIALIGFQSLNYMPVILVLTGFISVLLVMTRSYQDSEIVVWFSSGLSLTRWVKPVLLFGWPIVLLVAVLSFVVTPWANQQSSEYRERFEKREDIARVSPGKFQESASANRIFFVEGISGDASKVRNVFVNTIGADGKNSVVVAKEGETVVDKDGEKFVVMSKGRRYDGAPGLPDFQIVDFERYGLLIGNQSQAAAGDRSARAMQMNELLVKNDGFARGELLWRIALPLMGLSLMLLAIPLSFVNPRAGRSLGLLVALLLFVVYSNTVSVFQASVAQGRMSFMLGWWPVHAIVALLIVGMFALRLNINSRCHPAVIWSAMRRALIFKREA